MTLRPWLLLLWLWACVAGAAAPDFPALSGRVVDQARLLDAGTRQSLTERLARLEQRSSIQLVVVTLASLHDLPIEEYGYQLGRAWGIGQKGKNNGLLLLVAPQERKVRIEVGYGLEGDLPDAIAANIIQTKILPRFRQGDMVAGIEAGVGAIEQALAGQYEPAKASKQKGSGFWFFILIMIIMILLQTLRGGGGSGRGGRRGFYIGGGRSSSGFGGGGFRGGGGSFGGGGASGGW